jgi:cation diffusion facilitator family transporter
MSTQTHTEPEAPSARKERVALLSIVASAGITLAKLIAGMLSGSLALLSEAGHALVDTGATIITYFAVRTANRPADDDHQYGHGKVESLAALAETVVLFSLATVVVLHAWDRLMAGGGEVVPTPLAFGVLLVSMAVDVNRVVSLRKVAAETGSQALAADALHFTSDLAGSALVTVGLLAALAGFKYGDALAAFGVAAFIIVAGWRLGRQTIDTLLDKAPRGLTEQITALAASVPGVVEVGQVRMRHAGTHALGDVSVVVSRTLPLDRVAKVKQDITDAVNAALPGTALTIAVVPQALSTETALERVLLVAARRRVPVHHVIVQDLGGRLSVSLDVEVDSRLSMGAAHGIASRIEAALREEFGPETEVETHIEPLQTQPMDVRDADPKDKSDITQTLHALAETIPNVGEVHDVRVRRTDAGLIVTYHCRVDANTDVATAHTAVDSLEYALRKAVPGLVRVIGHAEPVRARA